MKHPHRQTRHRSQPGIALIEVIVAMGVLVIFTSAFTRLSLSSYDGSRQGREQTIASGYALEGIEAAKSIGQQDFANLVDGTHGLDDTSNYYEFSGASDTLGKYTRSVTIGSVNRDTDDNIVTSGGTVDEDIKSVTSEVTWTVQGSRTNTVSFLTYIANWATAGWIIDALSEFAAGFFDSTTATQTADGEVELEQLGSFDAPGIFLSYDHSSNANPTDLHIDPVRDRLYMTTTNLSSGAEFFAFDISNISDGVMTLSGSVDLGNNSDGFTLGRDYAYTLSRDNGEEVQVVRLSDMTITASWNVPSSANPQDIIVDEENNRAYVVTDDSANDEFYILDISNPSAGSINIIDQAELGDDVKGVAVRGDYAYVVTNNGSAELQIIDLTDTSTIAQCNLLGNQDGTDIYIEGTRLFIGREGGGQTEFIEYAINALDPDNCVLILAAVTGETQLDSDDVFDMHIDTELGYAFVLVSDSDEELAIIDLSDYSKVDVNLNQNGFCEGVAFLGRFIYNGCRHNTETIQVVEGTGGGSEEQVFTDGEQNSWALSDSGNTVEDSDDDTDNQFLVRTGDESLWINPGTSGYVEFDKTYETTASGALEMYVNSVSPWAFAVYSDNGGSSHSTTTEANATYGSAYATNDEEGGFTDFPQIDFDALEAAADTTILHTANNHLILDSGDLAGYAGQLVFVEITRSNRRLELDFDGSSATYNVSVVLKGGQRLQVEDYNNTTMTTKSASLPLLASDREIRFQERDDMTLNGFLYTEEEVNSSRLRGGDEITLNGSIIADRVDTSLERFTIAYTNDIHTTPPTGFTPTYSAQDMSIQADLGSAVDISDYITIDNDLSTWQKLYIPLADMGIANSTIDYVRMSPSADEPTFFIDDVRWTKQAASGGYPHFGTYTSPPFDSESASTSWNRIEWTESGDGSVSFRLRTASTEQNLKDALWVGSGGTLNTLYAGSGGEVITTDPSASGTRWIQLKAYLQGDGTGTPVLEDISVSF